MGSMRSLSWREAFRGESPSIVLKTRGKEEEEEEETKEYEEEKKEKEKE